VRSRNKERTFLIITFCGHDEIHNDREELQEKVLSAINDYAKGENVTFYLGGYGTFDWIALRACQEYKEIHPASQLLFITPYYGEEYFERKEMYIKECDGTVYPEVEKTPKRFAISKRNEWMIDKADYVIAYVNFSWGGAVKTLQYAIRHKKPFINFGTKEFED